MGKATFFGLYGNKESNHDLAAPFDYDRKYAYQDILIPTEGKDKMSGGASAEKGLDGSKSPCEQFALLELERPVPCREDALVIGSKLDTEIHANICRLAFYGRLLVLITDSKYTETVLPKVKVYKDKDREGVVERKVDDYSIICRGLFKKETNMDAFLNLKVTLSTGEEGMIESSFGQSGKFKVRIPGKIPLMAWNFFHCYKMFCVNERFVHM